MALAQEDVRLPTLSYVLRTVAERLIDLESDGVTVDVRYLGCQPVAATLFVLNAENTERRPLRDIVDERVTIDPLRGDAQRVLVRRLDKGWTAPSTDAHGRPDISTEPRNR